MGVSCQFPTSKRRTRDQCDSARTVHRVKKIYEESTGPTLGTAGGFKNDLKFKT